MHDTTGLPGIKYEKYTLTLKEETMFGLGILDFILSLCFIFFLSSLLASWVYELISILLKKRAATLRKVLYRMIGGGNDNEKGVDLLKALYTHPLIQERLKKGKDPVYIPDKEFGFVLLDMIKKNGEDPEAPGMKIDIDLLKKGVSRIKNQSVRNKLFLFIDAANAIDGDINEKLASIQKHFEEWFNNMMKCASALYKRFASIIMFLIGIGIAGILNIDSLQLINSLWYDSKLSETVSNAATSYIEDSLADENKKKKGDMDIFKELDALKLFPVGWNTYRFPEEKDLPGKIMSIVFKITGILISALAISQGGPFWFDLLVKATGLRKIIKQKKE